MKRKDLVPDLGRLGYTLLRPESSRVKEHEVLDLLDELADSEDSRLVEGPLFYGFGRHRIKGVCVGKLPTVQTDLLFVPDRFFTVPLTPFFFIASIAFLNNGCGTCRTFLERPLSFSLFTALGIF